MPARATHRALLVHPACYKRWAQLSAPQKAAAREMWKESVFQSRCLWEEAQMDMSQFKPTPLLNCYFIPEGDSVSQSGYLETDPQHA